MALYRFLFAPVLLAVAALIGARDRAATPPRSAPPAAQAQHAAAATPPVLVPAGERAALTHPAAVH